MGEIPVKCLQCVLAVGVGLHYTNIVDAKFVVALLLVWSALSWSPRRFTEGVGW